MFAEIVIENIEDAQRIADRAILVSVILEPWAYGESYDEVKEKADANVEAKAILNNMESFKFIVNALGRKMSFKEQLERMDLLIDFFEGKTVKLDDPDVIMYICEMYDPFTHVVDEEGLRGIYFGRVVALSTSSALVNKYSLKKRVYLGTTSMDAELSLVMSNMALATDSSFVCDPFCGTGSMLLTTSEFGSTVVGSELDARVIIGREDEQEKVVRNIHDNFTQYGTGQVFQGLIMSDFSLPVWRRTELFDAIITDPPYGVRAGAKKVGVKEGEVAKSIPDKYGEYVRGNGRGSERVWTNRLKD
eukprot:TRINITY_DN1885_c0_g1_i3.p1 TRINITY_DN1885_c0_g1~~TRINITY_DN1885_c0_g1_i3.p1  ORF type:complete len:304 (-),score=94.75 TRINITY_DN1885_c0_g1_i3:493-1404(-)